MIPSKAVLVNAVSLGQSHLQLDCRARISSARSRHAAAISPAQHRFHCRRCSTPAQASLFASVAETAALAAAVGGLTLSALPLLTGAAREHNADRPFNEETSEEDFVFGVMSVVSFLPYVNWTAWIFKALNDDDPALYYGLAALYGLPWVSHDLRLDGFTGLFLILGAIHVQVERIAATEPVQLRVPGASELAARVQAAVAKPAGQVVRSAQRKQISAGRQRPLPGQKDEDNPDKLLLDRWDDLFKQRGRKREKQ